MIKDRKELETHLENTIKTYKTDKKTVNKIGDYLLNNNDLLKHETVAIFNQIHKLEDLDKDLLIAFTSAAYQITKMPMIDPKQYFEPFELNKVNGKSLFDDGTTMKFPIRLENTIDFSSQDYFTKIKMSELVAMYDDQLIDYDYRAQRNAKIIKKNGKLKRAPNLNYKSVQAIADSIVAGNYFPDPITLNAEFGSAEDGDELSFSPTDRTLLINKCNLACLDGFHRLNAFVNVVKSHPEIDMEVPVMIKNYTIDNARKYFGQINTINVIDQSHLKSLKEERYADKLVKQLKTNSDLRGKISDSQFISPTAGHLVSFATLADAVDDVFEINSNKDVIELSSYLSKFFDMLIGSYPDAFIDKISEISKESIINNNNTFAGYVVLAKRFKENNISLTQLPTIMDSINFSKDNSEWSTLGILNNRAMTRQARKRIKKYFNDINLNLGGDENSESVQ